MKHIVMNPEGKYLYLGSTGDEWVADIELATDFGTEQAAADKAKEIGGGTVGTTNPRP